MAWICAARAAEAVVKVEVAEGGVEVVAPEQADHPAAEPDAFRVAGRPGQHAGGFGDLVDLLLAFLGGVGRPVSAVGRLAVAALGRRRGAAAKLNAATQSTAQNRRNEDINGIVPPVLIEAARPLSGLLCDRIGTLMRRLPPAAPAMSALKDRSPSNRRRTPCSAKTRRRKLGPNRPVLSSASTCSYGLKRGALGSAQARAISRSCRCLSAEPGQADAPWL